MNIDNPDFPTLARDIKVWGKELGFDGVGITNTDLSHYEQNFVTWLTNGFHGCMHYMEKHGIKRTHPAELVPGTVTIITVRMDYLPADTLLVDVLQNKDKAYISRYALGGDYHSLIRKRLQKLAEKIMSEVGKFGYRAFSDSAPILEKPLAEKSGLGWTGKNTLLLNTQAGSWFFLGELFTDLPLPIDTPANTDHCGACTACLRICPTQAIVAPYVLDAQRCISYLTIEHRGSIPVEFRALMGNRIYGCDDCQLICPWNRFANPTAEDHFKPRHGLHNADLIDLFLWTPEDFSQKTQGSAIARIGYECWLRNIAIALGNAPYSVATMTALQSQLDYPSELVKEHVIWAIDQQELKKAGVVIENYETRMRGKIEQVRKLNDSYEGSLKE